MTPSVGELVGDRSRFTWGLKVVSYCPRPHARMIIIARLWGALGHQPLKKKKKKSEKLAPKQGTNSNELSQGLSPCLRVCLINCGADEQALKQQRSSLMIPSTEFQLSPGVTSRIPNPAENTS